VLLEFFHLIFSVIWEDSVAGVVMGTRTYADAAYVSPAETLMFTEVSTPEDGTFDFDT
jgi:hypothetical protein